MCILRFWGERWSLGRSFWDLESGLNWVLDGSA